VHPVPADTLEQAYEHLPALHDLAEVRAVMDGMRQEGQAQVMAVQALQLHKDRPDMGGPWRDVNLHDLFSRMANASVWMLPDSAYPFGKRIRPADTSSSPSTLDRRLTNPTVMVDP
jgi:hypothetical protein